MARSGGVLARRGELTLPERRKRMSDNSLSLEGFAGTARLFPLPNLVLFPQITQPLHIFEPRYRQMMADALADDRLLAMALLQAGWEEDYDQRPPIHPVVCLGRIFEEEKLPDGRYTLLLKGLSRARILEELTTKKLYRSARVELLHDVPVAQPDREQALRQQLRSALRQRLQDHLELQKRLLSVMTPEFSLGLLCDVVAYAVPLPMETKQQLLQEIDCARRMERLLEVLPADDHDWLPRFSSN